jgi:hypothetical protein
MFSRLPRNNYFEVGWQYGDNIWVELVLDGRSLPLCGRKETVDDGGGRVEIAPPTSRVYVPVEDPAASLKLVRRCWSYNAVTKRYQRYGTGDPTNISGGGSNTNASRCG